MSRLCLVFLMAAWLAPAQNAPNRQREVRPPTPQTADAPLEFKIEEIRIEGSKLYRAEQVVPLTGLKVGGTGDANVFADARERLADTGAFASVGYAFAPAANGKGYSVTFSVADFQPMYPFHFDRLPVQETEMKAWLHQKFPLFTDKIPVSDVVLNRYRSAIRQYLTDHGQTVDVQFKVTDFGPGEVAVSFQPTGAAPVVAEVYFTGNQVIPQTALQTAINGVAVGIEYSEDRFRELLKTSVGALYEERGRIHVSFPKVETVPSTGVKGLRVNVTVDEGTSYSFGELKVDGAGSLDKDLLKAANLKGGEIANFDLVHQAQERIEQTLRHNGYFRAATKVERSVDEAKHIVNVTIHAVPGSQYKFGKVTFQGLDILAEAEMKKIWALDTGKPYNADYPDFFINRIKEDHIMENVGSKTHAVVTPHDQTLSVDVVMVFIGDAAPALKQRPPRQF